MRRVFPKFTQEYVGMVPALCSWPFRSIFYNLLFATYPKSNMNLCQAPELTGFFLPRSQLPSFLLCSLVYNKLPGKQCNLPFGETYL
jgi:hypothetical protein